MISSQKPCNLGKNNLSISITVGLLGLLISCIFTFNKDAVYKSALLLSETLRERVTLEYSLPLTPVA